MDFIWNRTPNVTVSPAFTDSTGITTLTRVVVWAWAGATAPTPNHTAVNRIANHRIRI
jgi:hypothetical protein